MARLFAYGSLAVVLVLYLSQIGVSQAKIGMLLTLALLGDILVSLWITTIADRVGRKRMLVAGAALMLFAGIVFAFTANYLLLVIAAIIGVISPGGNDIGPFMPIEQAALTQTVPGAQRTEVFAWYNLAGSLSTAIGALAGGVIIQLLIGEGVTTLTSYRVIVLAYAATGLMLGLLYMRLSQAVESPVARDSSISPELFATRFGLHRSKEVVLKLSVLFALDAFAGGLVLQSIMAYWFHLRFGVEPALLGTIFFGANTLAGLSALAASRIASRIGLINTMVFTHIPSNLLLMLVPLMPNLPWAITVLLLRFSISQMDVPTRQSYTMSVVSPDEFSAAAGITVVARSTGAALSPILAGLLLANPLLLNVPFFLAGSLKIVYDLLLFKNFRAIRENR
ncbi:MAG: MFS transporter [Geobacteraceae bacterium GWB2_52_12]|nr:MAG: MFS transporter [Geobacteraceae bacterium GWB2_52_12]